MRIQFNSKQTPVSTCYVWVTVFLSGRKKEDCSRSELLHSLVKEKIYTNKHISCEDENKDRVIGVALEMTFGCSNLTP